MHLLKLNDETLDLSCHYKIVNSTPWKSHDTHPPQGNDSKDWPMGIFVYQEEENSIFATSYDIFRKAHLALYLNYTDRQDDKS